MTNKRIIRVLAMMTVMFISLIGYLTYFEIFMTERISQNSYNKRQWAYEEGTIRGSITDRTGIVLAHSDGEERIYDYGSLYSHVIGYNSKIYGRTHIENKYNNILLGRDGIAQVFSLSGEKSRGYDLTLTIDHSLQRYAASRLGTRNGAVVALDPKTGAVLALVSKPDFDPSNSALIKNWTRLTEDERAPLLARATSGLYAPGSTFKIITAAAALENGLEGGEYDDKGIVEIGGTTFENFGKKANGKIDFEKAFALSSNFVFCTLGAQLGSGRLRETAQRFGFDKSLDFDIETAKSRFQKSDGDEVSSAALGIGQGETLATPLQMALTASAVANGGVIMQPYIMQRATDKNGETVKETKPAQLYRAVSPAVAERIKEMMVKAVSSGTGTSAAIRGVKVAGKTGTAENELLLKEKNREHTWFVGFAPADDPKIVVAVMLEYSGGSGGSLCAPIARSIMLRYLNLQ
ncbi:MAG: Penicillin-binding protein A [Firmicutes bacterium ADurb.Bin193]|nr:MAG: Penicillin-binding protein A [Firmicutes bacterium ADurb.Bin193]